MAGIVIDTVAIFVRAVAILYPLSQGGNFLCCSIREWDLGTETGKLVPVSRFREEIRLDEALCSVEVIVWESGYYAN